MRWAPRWLRSRIPETTHTPGVKEYPITLECRVLYAQKQELLRIPRGIGERMYPYGDNCLVVFYKDFSTTRSYTRIGHIDDAVMLQAAVGTGDVRMVFE